MALCRPSPWKVLRPWISSLAGSACWPSRAAGRPRPSLQGAGQPPAPAPGLQADPPRRLAVGPPEQALRPWPRSPPSGRRQCPGRPPLPPPRAGRRGRREAGARSWAARRRGPWLGRSLARLCCHHSEALAARSHPPSPSPLTRHRWRRRPSLPRGSRSPCRHPAHRCSAGWSPRSGRAPAWQTGRRPVGPPCGSSQRGRTLRVWRSTPRQSSRRAQAPKR
mmetsp:Transcript_5653/g.17824  ORF Transcript_5653/g.17824 Transcript_5653/m.17824 type:complete len:221 (+) Transcript_5653:264-926(+)